MVRRWSHINEVNNAFFSAARFEMRCTVNIFRNSVFYKKFVFKITKFKRKSIARLKHKSNWLIYTNVIRTWINDYTFNKHYLRFQFYNKIFVNNFFFFNFNFSKMRNESFFFNFNFFFATWSRKSYFYYNYNAFRYIKNSNITFGWFTKPPVTGNSVVPVYGEWDGNFYPTNLNKNLEFNFDNIFDFFLTVFLQQKFEIRKILILLFYYNLQKF